MDLDMQMDQGDDQDAFSLTMDDACNDMLVSRPPSPSVTGDFDDSMAGSPSYNNEPIALSPHSLDLNLGLSGPGNSFGDDYEVSAKLRASETQQDHDLGQVDYLERPDLDYPIDNPLFAKVVFPPLPPRLPAHETYVGSHSKWFVRAVLLLTAFLHAKHHVTFRACAVLLFCLRLIFISLGLIAKDDDMPITLNTVLKRLDLQDRFTILPACSQCHRLFQPIIPGNSRCPVCDIPLFNPPPPAIFQAIRGASKPSPKLSIPFSPLSSLLVDFLAQPGIEDAVEQWRTDEPSPPGEYKRVMDGRVWKEIQDHNKAPFFAEDSLTEDGELRIGVNISLDWFDHFHMSRKVHQLICTGSKPQNRRIVQATRAE